MDAQFAYTFFDGLHARLIGECGEWIFLGVKGFGGIKRATIAAVFGGS
jgi:hypothetical protein